MMQASQRPRCTIHKKTYSKKPMSGVHTCMDIIVITSSTVANTYTKINEKIVLYIRKQLWVYME